MNSKKKVSELTGGSEAIPMSNIKLVDGWKTMSKWEVMRQVEEEGKRVAFKFINDTWWMETDTYLTPQQLWDWTRYDYAIIDETQPVIEWDEFDWDFFKPFGGVPVVSGIGVKGHKQTAGKSDIWELRPSPFYYWPGGECPVPENCEVGVIFRDGGEATKIEAGELRWEYAEPSKRGLGKSSDIIAFRLTGKVYPPKHKEVV